MDNKCIISEELVNELHSLQIDKKLGRMISGIFVKSGIMVRITSRTKRLHSLNQKLRKEKYVKGEKKLQDLFGIRINVFFVEDLILCKEMFKQFDMIGDWETGEIKDNTFNPLKTNGIFKLPKEYQDAINPKIWECGIDRTYEIQIRTILFEGWHEIEHDLRYKLKKRSAEDCVWNKEYAFEYSRRLNAIVATLELCDKEMENIFEEFSEKLFENREWDEFIRMHFRVRISGEKLLPEYAKELDENLELSELLWCVSKEQLVSMIAKDNYMNNSESTSVNQIFRLIKALL